MDYYNKWYVDLLEKSGSKWLKDIQVQETYKKRSGPKSFFAEVLLGFSASKKFEVENLLETNINQLAQNEKWYDAIIFGVLDIFLTYPESPIKNFKLTIHQIRYDEIDSVPFAFRMAARKAAKYVLEKQS